MGEFSHTKKKVLLALLGFRQSSELQRIRVPAGAGRKAREDRVALFGLATKLARMFFEKRISHV